jgi:hypothetical protein
MRAYAAVFSVAAHLFESKADGRRSPDRLEQTNNLKYFLVFIRPARYSKTT